jgi:ribosomal-protein-alanine N-acetyltransferase
MVETKRLIIQPLTYPQVLKFIELNNELESELRLNAGSRSISDQLRKGVENYTLPWLREHVDDYLYYTIWIVISKEDKTIVADLSFKGAPNENGEIEIGYGTQLAHQNKGYMTEAVAAMIHWAKQQKIVKAIRAETHKDNIPSIMILKKNQFLFLEQKGEMLWWLRKL